jgi:thymidylate synthase
MFHIVEAETADELWRGAAQWFADEGVSEQDGRGGLTAEVLHAGLSLHDPRQRWVASRVPAMNPAFAIAEVVWIVTGRRDSGFLNFFNPSLPKYQGDGSVYGRSYGSRLREHFGLDQLNRACAALRANPDSRQIVLQIWDPASDFPLEDGSPQGPDIPCNIVSVLKVRNGRLEWTQIMRSNDLFRGLPHNIVQFTCLQEVMAGWLGVDLGSYNHFSDSLHLYHKDGIISESLQPFTLPKNPDNLALPKNVSDSVFTQLGEFGNLLVSVDRCPADIDCAFAKLELPGAYRNLAAVLAAEALRRGENHAESERMIGNCTNSCLIQLFARWNARVST